MYFMLSVVCLMSIPRIYYAVCCALYNHMLSVVLRDVLFINFSRGGGWQTAPWSKKKNVDPPHS